MTWPTYTLEEVAAPTPNALATGPFGSAVASHNFRPSGVPMLRGSNLSTDVGVRLLEDDVVYLDPTLAASFTRSIARRGDLVFTSWGTVGQLGLIGRNALNAEYIVSNKQMKLTPDPQKCDSTFLYYCLSSGRSVRAITEQSIGSTIPGFNLGQLRKLKVELPPLPEQQAIAEVLGALDDKIAANRALVATSLELVAAHHTQTKATAAMHTVRYAEEADVGGGATPSTKESSYWGGDIPWAAPSDVTALAAPYLEDTPRKVTEAGLAACSSPLYPKGSILMTSRATIGAFAVTQVPTAVNQGFIVVQPYDPTLRWWLLAEMQDRVPEYINRANGATFLELPRRVFREMEFTRPEDATLRCFDQLVAPLHEAALFAHRESATLATLRDTLLPALMDGTLRVKDAQKAAEEVL